MIYIRNMRVRSQVAIDRELIENSVQEELDDAHRVAEDAMQEAANKEEQLQLVVTETEALVEQVRSSGSGC